jgi:Protein of unknown function (DUF3093)
MGVRGDGGMYYRERPRCPLWVYLGFFLVPAGFGGACIAVFQALSPRGAWWAAGVAVLVISALAGTLPRLSQRLIVVDDAGLHIGRYTIPAREIASTHGVAGAELKRLRHEIADIGNAWIGLTGVGPLASGIANVAAGLLLIQSESRRRGMLCSPWQAPALLIQTPDLPTKQWLIAARDPPRLEHAIEQTRAANGVSAPGDPDELDLGSVVPRV